MTLPNRALRPVLAKGVRYRWDPIREQHQLLFPEGLLTLNAAAAAIVRLCDGQSVEAICTQLAETFPDADPSRDVEEFLQRLAGKGLLYYDGVA